MSFGGGGGAAETLICPLSVCCLFNDQTTAQQLSLGWDFPIQWLPNWALTGVDTKKQANIGKFSHIFSGKHFDR